jgi:hypothetical protein
MDADIFLGNFYFANRGSEGDKESVFIMFSGYETIQKIVLDLGIFDQTLFLRCSLNNPLRVWNY